MVDMCRACLTTGVGMVQMDETFLCNYNILTSLHIPFAKDVPIYCCNTCFDAANFCINFREKCIASDQTFKEILFPDCKQEDEGPTDEINAEIEIKYETAANDTISSSCIIKFEQDNDSLCSYFEECNNYDDEEYLELTTENIEDKPLPNTENKTQKKKLEIINPELDCVVCPEKFKDTEALTKHLENHKLDVACIVCKENFINLPHLLGHRIEHMPEKQRRCHICSKKFIVATSLEYHYMKIHELAEKDAQIQCKKCPTCFDNGRKLQKHIGALHSVDSLTIKCKHCSMSFINRYKLKIHMHKHKLGKLYECDLCEYTTKHYSGIKAHKIGKHTESRVYCRRCNSVFPSQSVLDQHVCGRAKASYICPICGKNLENARGNSLTRHMKSHTDVCPYKCDKCPAKFKALGNYKTHMDKHAGTPKHKCEHCDRSFYASSVLIKHRRTHTGEKPYVCTICSKGFTGNHNLKVHMKVHGIVNLITKKESTK